MSTGTDTLWKRSQPHSLSHQHKGGDLEPEQVQEIPHHLGHGGLDAMSSLKVGAKLGDAPTAKAVNRYN
jgi:hypothetical protein